MLKMDMSTSTDDEMVEFVLGCTKPSGFPSPEAWVRIFESTTAIILHDLQYYGLREFKEDEGDKISRMIARDVVTRVPLPRLRQIHAHVLSGFYLASNGEWLIVEIDIDHTRVLRHQWVSPDDLATVFRDDAYPQVLPIQLLDGLCQMVEDRLEQAEQRIETFRFARDALKPIVYRARRLPLISPVST
jgi:hypothetical protein